MATFLMGADGRHFLGEIIFAIVSSRLPLTISVLHVILWQ